MPRFFASALTLTLTLTLTAADPPIPERDALLRKAAAVRPTAGNFRWQQIPWLTDPDEALETARHENRPLLVWIAGGRGRDGTPLERCCGYAACLRAGPLNDPKVVKLIADNFVPIALKNNILPDSDAGRFFKKLTERWSQGLWVVTPDGQELGFHYHKNLPGVTWQKNEDAWRAGTLAMLEEALRQVGPLARRGVKATNPFPDRGRGPADDGGVRLAVGVVGMLRGLHEGPPAVDSIRLSDSDWSAFAPPGGQDQWTIPDPVARQFAPALSPLTDSIFVPQADDVQKATVSGKLVRTANGVQVIRYSGRWESAFLRDNDPKHPITASASGEGVGVYDTTSGQMRSVVWLLRGTYRNGNTGTPLDTAAVIEWVSGE